jgi:hypothetical protein
MALGIGEVAQSELEVMHAVDERQVDRQAAEFCPQVVPGEKGVARLGEDALVRLKRTNHLRLGIDTDRERGSLHQAQRRNPFRRRSRSRCAAGSSRGCGSAR